MHKRVQFQLQAKLLCCRTYIFGCTCLAWWWRQILVNDGSLYQLWFAVSIGCWYGLDLIFNWQFWEAPIISWVGGIISWQGGQVSCTRSPQLIHLPWKMQSFIAVNTNLWERSGTTEKNSKIRLGRIVDWYSRRQTLSQRHCNMHQIIVDQREPKNSTQPHTNTPTQKKKKTLFGAMPRWMIWDK